MGEEETLIARGMEEEKSMIPRAERIIAPKTFQRPIDIPIVLKEGHVYKKSRYLKQWKLRWVVIMSNGFAFTYPSAENKSSLTETFNLIAFFQGINLGVKKANKTHINTFILHMEDMEQIRSFEFRSPNPSLTIP